MEGKALAAQIRSERKKGAAKRLRRNGRIPGIVYGAQREPTAVSIDEHEFSTTFKYISESTIISLNAEKQSFDVLIKDYQIDVLTGRLLHIDFYEIQAGKTVTTHIPVHVHGSPKGVREGGILEHPLYEVEIECLPKDLPEDLQVDVSNLDIGDSLHIGDLTPPPGVTITTSEDQIVALVSTPQAIEEPEAEEEEALEEGEEEAAEGEETEQEEQEE